MQIRTIGAPPAAASLAGRFGCVGERARASSSGRPPDELHPGQCSIRRVLPRLARSLTTDRVSSGSRPEASTSPVARARRRVPDRSRRPPPLSPPRARRSVEPNGRKTEYSNRSPLRTGHRHHRATASRREAEARVAATELGAHDHRPPAHPHDDPLRLEPAPRAQQDGAGGAPCPRAQAQHVAEAAGTGCLQRHQPEVAAQAAAVEGRPAHRPPPPAGADHRQVGAIGAQQRAVPARRVGWPGRARAPAPPTPGRAASAPRTRRSRRRGPAPGWPGRTPRPAPA